MSRMTMLLGRGALLAFGGVLCLVGSGTATGCDSAEGGSGAAATGGTAGSGASSDAGHSAGGGTAGAGAVGGAGGAGASGGAGCPHDGALGDPCEEDCDCAVAYACRGLPGEQACSVPCETWDGCEAADIGCADRVCDLNVGACQCVCTVATCPDGQCAGSYCVGCASDEHCVAHTCGSDPGLGEPRCRLDTESCVCGGKCGDGVCDEAESAARTCPSDCAAPCVEGAQLAHSCTAAELVPWCRCESSSWQCVDPTSACPGDTACQQQGGTCLELPESCYPGPVDPDPHGCSGLAPYCCLPATCTGPGLTYPPGGGLCCPGLRALDSAMPSPGMDPEVPGVTCFANCWQLTCAPCGDGVCEPHLTENFCNCPEDCPQPPYPLVCSESLPDGCGHRFCRQEGTVCQEELPSCGADGQCSREVHERDGWLCDPVEAACVEP